MRRNRGGYELKRGVFEMAWLFEMPVFLLTLSDTVENGLLFLFVLILCVKFLRGTKGMSFFACLKSFHPVALMSAVGLGFIFYINWIASSKLATLAEMVHLPVEVFHGLLSGAIALSAVPGMSILCHQIQAYFRQQNTQELACDGKLSRGQKLWLLVFTVCLVTLCSKCSPIYPFNDWVDANCFFTVGKSMLSGLVPYRDLMEQKGPMVYFLHAFAALISYRTFFAIWLVELVVCFAFACYAAKTIALFTRLDKVSLGCLSLMMTIAYASYSFAHGDSTEELCLAFLAYANFVGLRAMKQGKLPELREFFIIGITSGCVLWTKYSLLGFYIGWIIVPFVLSLRNREIVRFAKSIGAVVLGVALISVPVVVYFAWQGALGELFNVYFINNITGYSHSETSGTLIENVIHGGVSMSSPFLYVLLMAGALWAWAKKQSIVLWNQLLCYLVLFVMIYGGGRDYNYYAFILWFIIPFGTIAMADAARSFAGSWAQTSLLKKLSPALCLLICLTLAYFYSSNTYLLKHSQEELPQYRAKQIIEQYDLDHEPTLLNYGFLDGGFYTTLGIVPTCRCFCWLNIDLQEIWDVQNECVMEQQVDFVVTRDADIPEDAPYQLIDTYSFYFSGGMRTYKLYYRS